MTDDRVEWHLWNWANWMGVLHRDGPASYPKRSTGINTQTCRVDFATLVETADARCAEATDALLEDMAPAMRAAVHHKHLYAVYRFPRGNLEVLYRTAVELLGRGLVRRGID